MGWDKKQQTNKEKKTQQLKIIQNNYNLPFYFWILKEI